MKVSDYKINEVLMEDIIKQKAINSTIWKFLERICAKGVSFIVSIVIARILCPEDYAVVAIIAIFFSISDIIISGGLNTALIQKKVVTQNDYSVVLIISVALSVIVYVVLYICAPWLAQVYDMNNLIQMIRIMGIILPIHALKSVLCALVSRSLEFRSFFYSTLVGTIVSGVVGIVSALKGLGAWALIIQQMTNATIDTVLLFLLLKPSFTFQVNFKTSISLFKYGWKILMSSLIGSLYSNVTPLIIGVRYTSDQLSFFSKGQSFPHMITEISTSTVSSVLFPVLSNFQNDRDRFLSCIRLFIRLSSYLAFPLMLGLFAISDNFIICLLTEKWIGSAIFIKVFSISSLVDMLSVANGQAVKALGKSGLYFILETIKRGLSIIILLLFVFFSRNAVILAISAVVITIICTIFNSVVNVVLLKYSIKDQVFDILPNLILATIMCVCVYLMSNLFYNNILVLILQVVGGSIIYVCASIITKNKSFFYLLKYAKRSFYQRWNKRRKDGNT